MVLEFGGILEQNRENVAIPTQKLGAHDLGGSKT